VVNIFLLKSEHVVIKQNKVRVLLPTEKSYRRLKFDTAKMCVAGPVLSADMVQGSWIRRQVLVKAGRPVWRRFSFMWQEPECKIPYMEC